MEVKKNFLYLISIVLFLSCESTLNSPSFEVYLCPVKDVNVNLKNSLNLNLNWTYPDESIEDICDENADSFIVYYLTSDDILSEIPRLDSNSEDFISVPFEYNQSGNYSIDFPITDSEKYYYFNVYVKYFDDFSAAYGETSYISGLGLPSASCSFNCGEGFDSDCLQCIVNNDNLNISEDYSELYLKEKITDENGNIIRTQSFLINEQSLNNNIIRNLSLDYVDCEMGTNINDLYSCVLYDSVENQGALKPNTNYQVEYYYSQIIDDNEYPENPIYTNPVFFSFNRMQDIDISSKPISNVDFRLYLEDVSDLQFYDTIHIWGVDIETDELLSVNPIIEKDISNNKINNIFDNDIHVDIEDNQLSGNYYVALVSDKNHYGRIIYIDVLDINGFRLIDDFDDSDYYMSIYELTEEDYLNGEWTSIHGNMPAELNKSQCEDYINNLSFYSLSPDNYSFRLPTNDEWVYAASKNIYLNTNLSYPWGNTIDSFHANYFNSDYPLLTTGINELSAVGYFSNFISPFGLYDMSGNVSEWVSLSSNFVGKGGNYLSDIDGLLVENILDNLVIPGFSVDTNVGMGCRILLKIN